MDDYCITCIRAFSFVYALIKIEKKRIDSRVLINNLSKFI